MSRYQPVVKLYVVNFDLLVNSLRTHQSVCVLALGKENALLLAFRNLKHRSLMFPERQYRGAWVFDTFDDDRDNWMIYENEIEDSKNSEVHYTRRAYYSMKSAMFKRVLKALMSKRPRTNKWM